MFTGGTFAGRMVKPFKAFERQRYAATGLQTLRRHGHLWTVRPTFNFPDRLEFFSSSNSSKEWSYLNCSTGLRLSGSTWIFFVFKLFEGVVNSTCTSIGSFPQTCNLSSLLHAFWHYLYIHSSMSSTVFTKSYISYIYKEEKMLKLFYKRHTGI